MHNLTTDFGFNEKCKMMEHELMTLLGISLQDELSSREISSLCENVFHVPVRLEEVHNAVMKVCGCTEGTHCNARNLFDTLLEIERQHFIKDQLYWDFQLLTGDRPSQLSLLLESGNALKLYHNLISYGGTINQALEQQDYEGDQTQSEKIKKQLYLWRLKKEARMLCDRWSVQGLRAVLCDNGDSIKRTKYLTTHDLLRVVDDKYEIMQQKLYTEMLEDHYGCSSWEAMLGWEKEEKLGEMQALTEHAFKNNDSVSLSKLPGGFRLYRILEWTAVYNLMELHKNCQEEKDSLKKKLAFNSKSNFDESAWALLHLYLQASVLKAKRQRCFQTAVLASHQCWDKWPEVKSSHLEELARYWLMEVGLPSWDKSKKKSGYSMQQTALESLMARQEWEREYLIKLLHSITPEVLWITQNTKEQNLEPFIELSQLSGDSLLESAEVFRKGCALKLRKVRSALEETAQEAMWGDCAACVLTELIQQQEQELSSTMKALVHMNEASILSLQEQYETELHDQQSANLMQLLFSLLTQQPLPARKNEDAEICGGGDSSEDMYGVMDPNSMGNQETPNETNENKQENSFHLERKELCSACGNVFSAEEIPYLEVLCDSNKGQNVLDEICVDGEVEKNEDNSSYEKQGSLIAVAWSKQTEATTETEKATLEHETEDTKETDTNELPTEEKQGPAPESRNLSNSEFIKGGLQAEDAQEMAIKKAGSFEPVWPGGVQRERSIVHISEMEREETMRSLVDLQRKAESKRQKDKERQMLRVQERLSILRNRKSDEDMLGNKQGDGLKHLTENLKKEDKSRQKTLVREKLEQVRRERTHIMQSKRDRNTAGFKELLDPVVHSNLTRQEDVKEQKKSV